MNKASSGMALCTWTWLYLWGICSVIGASGNLLCDTDSWNEVKGSWTYTAEDCSLENTDSGSGNIVWFGSADGLTPDSTYDHDTFELTATLEMRSGGDAGLLFRTGESSTNNDEGPTYYVGLYPGSDKVVFGTMDDGWSAKHSASVPGLAYDTLITLSVYGSGDVYTVLVDGVARLTDITRTEFSFGSIGLRTFHAPTIYESLSYQGEDSAVECTRTYEGGCGNWGDKTLNLNYNEVHTVEECYEKCAANAECGGFFLGTSSWHCLLARAGCTDDNNRSWDYYAMDDCVAVKNPTKEPSREPTNDPTEGPTEEPTQSPTKDCSALHIDEFLVDCSTEFDGHGDRIESLESGGSAMMDTVTGHSLDIANLEAAASDLENSTTTMSAAINAHGVRIGSIETEGSSMAAELTQHSQDIRDLKATVSGLANTTAMLTAAATSIDAKMQRIMEHLDILGDYQTESGMTPVVPMPLDTSDYALYALAATNLIVVMCLAVYCVFVRATTPKYGKVAMYGTETEA